MIGTYAAVLAVCGASLAMGQAAISLCGIRRWCWLAPAVGLALLCAICWATVRMPGHGTISAVAVLVLTVAAAVYLRGRVEGGGEALRAGLPVAVVALFAASLPFVVEGHFGILGTGFNPDMSQHLLATDRLAGGAGSQLLHQGYPLGPHAIAVALNKGLGIGLVQGFSGLTVAAAVLAPLTALTAFDDQPRLRRTAAALLVGVPYLVASYFAQGAFKETIQALFVLAFVLALRESTRTWQDLPLRFVPAAILAIGSVYVYSFPGLIWLATILLIWLLLTRSLPVRPLLLASIVFAVGALPELGRMIDFHNFETFDPNGPGLGNLFGQVSPFTALGIWPSGDFRLAPGDGAVPAFVYYLGAAFAAVLLVYGLIFCLRRRERTVLAGVLAVALLYAAARLGGTPYTSAKALELAAPVLTLAIMLPLAPPGRLIGGMRRKGAPSVALVLYLLAAGVCTLLAFANAPVGPTSYSPALTGLRPLLATGSTLFLAPESLLEEEQGARYVAWELRGGRVCIEPEGAAGGRPPSGVRFVVIADAAERAPFRGLRLRRHTGPYLLWERRGPVAGPSDCPLIAERQARQGP
ncbi:MAG TPA: hypothetical protein VN756_08160 [Solirubrobacterales bacterium]|nr:hypothetical protein [Solirubrobacterales bacterium]